MEMMKSRDAAARRLWNNNSCKQAPGFAWYFNVPMVQRRERRRKRVFARSSVFRTAGNGGIRRIKQSVRRFKHGNVMQCLINSHRVVTQLHVSDP